MRTVYAMTALTTLRRVSKRDQVIWMRPEGATKGRPPAYTRSQIAQVAIAVADAEGLAAVSVRRVTREIGAGTMSLYRYIRSKEELFALMADEVTSEQPPDGPGEPTAPRAWQQQLRELAIGARALVLQHPWLPIVLSSTRLPGPRLLQGTESALAVLDGLGLTVAESMEIIGTVMALATGTALNEIGMNGRMPGIGPRDDTAEDSADTEYLKVLLTEDGYPRQHQLMTSGALDTLDPDAVYERSVDRLIAGIEAAVLHIATPAT